MRLTENLHEILAILAQLTKEWAIFFGYTMMTAKNQVILELLCFTTRGDKEQCRLEGWNSICATCLYCWTCICKQRCLISFIQSKNFGLELVQGKILNVITPVKKIDCDQMTGQSNSGLISRTAQRPPAQYRPIIMLTEITCSFGSLKLELVLE